MLRLTAQLADVWSAFGGIDVADEQAFVAAIKQQTAVIDRCCDEIGRDPQSLRRSLVAFRPFQPWSSRDALGRLIDNVRPLGFEEITLYKPASTDEQRVFDAFVADRLARLGLR